MTGIFAGSFDPVTIGHRDVIQRAARLMDRLYVGILDNSEKKYMFSRDARLEMVRQCCGGLANVQVEYFGGLLVEYAHSRSADCIVRGIRNSTDYEYEKDIAHCNKLLGGVETVFLPTRAEYSAVSSSVVREVLRFGGDISPFVSKEVLQYIALNNF